MKDKTAKLTILAIIFAIIAIAFSVYATVRVYRGFQPDAFNKLVEDGIQVFIQKQQEQANKPVRVAEKIDNKIASDDPALGNADATITLIEFSDFQCPYCGKFYEDTLIPFEEKFVETGKVRFIFRDFPLEFHENARPAALAAECAGEQKGDEVYFKYHDTLFQNQAALDDASLKKYATTLGLDKAAFAKCLDSKQFDKELNDDFTAGQEAGVNGTPASFLLMTKDESKADALKAMEITQGNQYIIQYIETEDGKLMGLRISGAHPLSTFEKAIGIGL